jgi:site-specific DNA-cytosine methylase
MLAYHPPIAFLFENVPLLLRHHKGETWRQMRAQAEALGYHVQAFELNRPCTRSPSKGATARTS